MHDIDEIAPPIEWTARSVKIRLWVMMFLQYFVQGCYLPIVSLYLQDSLGFDGVEINLFGSALAVGPLVAPFVFGQIVDRLYSTQHVLAVCHLAGGIVMLSLYAQVGFWPVVILGTLYSILYVPSLMLTNSLTFHHLKERDREFPLIRLWGTVGFVMPAWIVELYWLKDRSGARVPTGITDLWTWLLEMLNLPGLEGAELNSARGIVLWLAGAAGLVMAAYSLTLPNTPPPKQEKKDFAPGKVIRLLSMRHFMVLVIVSFGIAIVHKFYFGWNSPFISAMLEKGDIKGALEQRISSIGQIVEVLVMAGLGFAIHRYGFKRTMLVGTIAYFTRCLIFAFASGLDSPFWLIMSLVCFGQALHGFCFGCFLAAAYMYADRCAPIDIRGSMQTFYGTFVIGGGFFIGGFVSSGTGKLFETPLVQATLRGQFGISSTAGLAQFTNKAGEVIVRDWIGIWLTCGMLALVCVIAFAAFFPKNAQQKEPTG